LHSNESIELSLDQFYDYFNNALLEWVDLNTEMMSTQDQNRMRAIRGHWQAARTKLVRLGGLLWLMHAWDNTAERPLQATAELERLAFRNMIATSITQIASQTGITQPQSMEPEALVA